MNLLMAFLLAFYFQKWHFMAFWDGKFGIPLAKNVGNTGRNHYGRNECWGQLKNVQLNTQIGRS